MKKLVKVTVEKEIEVEIKDELLTEEAIKEFSSYMWKTDINNLFEYAAKCAFDDDGFVEGLGFMESNFLATGRENVLYSVVYEDLEAEILEDM